MRITLANRTMPTVETPSNFLQWNPLATCDWQQHKSLRLALFFGYVVRAESHLYAIRPLSVSLHYWWGRTEFDNNSPLIGHMDFEIETNILINRWISVTEPIQPSKTSNMNSPSHLSKPSATCSLAKAPKISFLGILRFVYESPSSVTKLVRGYTRPPKNQTWRNGKNWRL